MRPLRRRDFLTLSAVAVAGLAVGKIGGRLLLGPHQPARALDPSRLHHLSVRQEAIVTAAALALVGPAAEAAYHAGDWDPAAGMDELLSRMAPDQRKQLGVALHLFEEWTLGLSGFSSWDRDRQLQVLAAWRTSSLGLQRSVWGFLHAATASSFSGGAAGQAVMDYPGPCVGAGRKPGQTTHFPWDEGVP